MQPERKHILGAKQVHIFGHKSGHGDQISVGRVQTGPLAGKYYVSIVNDGYPDRFSAGGFCEMLPESVVKKATVGAILRFVKTIYSCDGFGDWELSDRKIDFGAL